MPVTSVTRDPATLSFVLVADFPVPQQRLWDAYADPRQLERFWGPPNAPVKFARHDFAAGGRSEYVMTLPGGQELAGSWKFVTVDPIRFFEALDGDDNADDPDGPAGMTFTFETTPAGSRVTIVTRFLGLEAMERSAVFMEEGMRAAVPQLDALLAEPARA